MLGTLHIENIAVFDKVSIDFSNGFTVLTGETGAGKSIIIDAINLVLGERASKNIIRNGASSCYVSASFFNLSDELAQILKQQSLYSEDSLIITREIFLDGRNNCKINGKPVNVSMLKEISAYLINIHGQTENHQLLNKNNHVFYLDKYAGNEQILDKYSTYYKRAVVIKNEIAALTLNEQEKQQKIEVLEYQIKEIENANLIDGELEKLTEKKKLASNSLKISNSINGAYNSSFGVENDIATAAYSMLSSVSAIKDINDKYNDLYSRINSVYIELLDIKKELMLIGEDIQDENDLEEIEQRLAIIYKLRSKYGETIGDIINYCEECKTTLEQIAISQDKILELNDELVELKEKLKGVSDKLTVARQSSAIKLEKAIEYELSYLDMPNIKFKIDIKERQKFSPLGKNDIEFLISSNQGEPLKPMAKIASGGEMSRIMLSLKTILTTKDDADTFIFDEVDSGVSGKTAQKLGIKLKKVSTKNQVICVTHLAQVASIADNHFFISKKSENGFTYTNVQKITGKDRIMEISRIIAGINITQTIIDTATEMLNFKYEMEKD